jgi:hypothetical protein
MLDSAVIGKANTLAPNLAHTILEEGDFDALPIFADTLEDAGCNDPAILNACRDTSPTRSRNYPNLFHQLLNTPKERIFPDWQAVYRLANLGQATINQVTKLIQPHYGCQLDQDRWVIPMLPGITPNKSLAILRQMGVKVWTCAKNDDLNKVVTKNSRDPKKQGAYLVSIKATPEADEDYADLTQTPNPTHITLNERLFIGISFFLATGTHLDQKVWGRCSGSRSSDGDVPEVDWHSHSSELIVLWYNPDIRHDFLRSRSVGVLVTAVLP